MSLIMSLLMLLLPSKMSFKETCTAFKPGRHTNYQEISRDFTVNVI